jgi:hypothetical protein
MFELGGNVGSDLLLVGLNIHNNFEVHLLNTQYGKLSLANKGGVMLMPLHGYGLLYTAPGPKLSIPFWNTWFTVFYSREYIMYFGGEHLTRTYDDIDHRIDFGLKFYKSEQSSMEIYYPLRLDPDVVPWWTGGIVLGINYLF